MNKSILERNFSRCAHLYDTYATIQNLAASELSKRLPAEGIESILEIGCGTGNYTSLLRKKFRDARIMAMDISGKMIELAKQKNHGEQIEFVVGDAEKIDIDTEFSLVTSNATFQWIESIEKAIEKYKKAIKREGVIAFSIFGPLTFGELNQSLREAIQDDVAITSQNFLEKKSLDILLRRYFKKINIEELVVKETYCSLMELLIKIKNTGTRGRGLNGSYFLNRSFLANLEDIYIKKFGQIEASYQIFFCKATK